MSSKAKSNLILAALFVGAALLGVLNVPMWTIVLGMVGVVLVVIAYAVISGALQQRKAGDQYQSAKQLMRQGDLQAALDKLLQCQPVDPHARVVVDLDVALGHALLGDLGAAREALATADDQAGDRTRVYQAYSTLVRAVIDCRSDRCAEAAQELDQVWRICEAELTGAQLRPLRIVRAFAVSNGGAHAGGSPETALATVRPAFAGEHDYLGKAWPEMARYLADNGLSR